MCSATEAGGLQQGSLSGSLHAGEHRASLRRSLCLPLGLNAGGRWTAPRNSGRLNWKRVEIIWLALQVRKVVCNKKLTHKKTRRKAVFIEKVFRVIQVYAARIRVRCSDFRLINYLLLNLFAFANDYERNGVPMRPCNWFFAKNSLCLIPDPWSLGKSIWD